MVDGTGLENQRVKAPQVRILSLPPRIMNRRRRRKIWILPCLILAGFLIFVGVRMISADTETEVHLTYTAPTTDFSGLDYSQGFGQWAVALNGKTIAKSADKLPTQPTASTAKMIMALAVMEKKPFSLGESGETITITDELYNIYHLYNAVNGSTTPVQIGEEISEYDALVSALIASSNNMADALAIWAFGSLPEYQKYAQEMLERLGANDTTVGPDASGFDAETTSTAEDLAKIGEAVLRQPVLAEIVGKSSAVVPVAGLIENTNKILGIDGIVGVKTGYIGDASGYCLVSGYKEGEEIITLAVLGAPYRQTSFDATLELVEDAQKKITSRVLVEKDQEIGYYENWWSGKTPIMTGETISGVIISDVEAKFSDTTDKLEITSPETAYSVSLRHEDFPSRPSFWQRFLHVFGWEIK